jgi:glycine/D-amino acid oxidase-like deaminating enzyme
MTTMPTDYRQLSLWHDTVDDSLHARPALPGDRDVDVAIVGAGFTGLWTAYYLAVHDPSLRIMVIEREIAGFGASGRNGGWVSALLPTSMERLAKLSTRDRAVAMQHAMNHTVDEIVRVAQHEQIDAHAAKGGYLHIATNPAHVPRLRAEIDHWASWGFGPDHHRYLDRRELASTLRIGGALAAHFTADCAAVHPARLVRGLAHAVERLGVTIHEQTTVVDIAPRLLRTDRGTVKADIIVRALEGFTPSLTGHQRMIAPVYSLMIATEPLPHAFFDEVGWQDRQTFNDDRHLIIYGQRTADNRIAFGGRGAPYHFGSRVDPRFDRDATVHDGLQQTLVELFPQLGDATITHRWGGPLGITRDWTPSVGLDRRTGLAWAGGYVGDGVATTNLAGRTLRDLITGADSDLVTLPWVQHQSRLWEPEPLRWLGINAGLRLPALADHIERRTGRESRVVTAALNALVG